ncbi:putative reverse transcriptase domain-containing protein [Tanacetum coccineum]
MNEAKRNVLRQNATNEAKRSVLRQSSTNEAKRSVLRQNATNEEKLSVLRQNAMNEAKRSVLRANVIHPLLPFSLSLSLSLKLVHEYSPPILVVACVLAFDAPFVVRPEFASLSDCHLIVAAAMAEAEASRVRNGYDGNGSGPRPAQAALRESSDSLDGLRKWSLCLALAIAQHLVKSNFATCTLQDDALTWWNAHVKTTTPEAAHAMPWATLKKMMTDKYCPRGEIKKIETEMWNLKVKGTDVVAYNRRFQQLALMCARMFPEEVDKIEKYIGGLPDMILGSVKASKPKTMQEAIEFTTELIDEKTHAYVERQAEKKRKYDDLSKNNQNQQQQNKRQNTGQAYTAGNSDRKPYAGSKPLCSKCDYNHEGPCPPRCNNCKKVGHLAKDCRSRPANANNNNRNNNNNNQKGNGCYECGAQGHFKRNCPKLKNNDRGNQAGNDRAPAKVYVVGNAGANPDNVVAGTFLLNNRYAYILFDMGADRSFVSTAFSSQIDITPSTLDHYYDVELADGRIIGLNTILSGSFAVYWLLVVKDSIGSDSFYAVYKYDLGWGNEGAVRVVGADVERAGARLGWAYFELITLMGRGE